MKILKGITWNHSRGFTSIVAASQRFSELNPGVEIQWHKRSLQAFADESIHALAEEYDLLIIDHPWAGYAKKNHILVNLKEFLTGDYLADQAQNSVGKSHISYDFDGFQAALAVDAATPIAIYNNQWFNENNAQLPNTWEAVLALAKAKKVAIAGIPINLLMDYLMFGATIGKPMFDGEAVLDHESAKEALEQIRALTQLCDPSIFEKDPIGVYEMMAASAEIIYCPYAYGYSNYSKEGYGRNLLQGGDLVSYKNKPLSSVIGGTGIAVSTASNEKPIAAKFAEFCASPLIQSTLYFDAGGQPGHRKAWVSEEVNRRAHNFFKNTLQTLDNSYLRPRYSGYMHFQDHAGIHVQEYAKNGGNSRQIIEKINALYRESLNLS